jgi:predicted enzyme related to lactoylglutathione lyase
MAADTLCWTDIPVTNLNRAIKFYSAVLGKAVRRLAEGKMEYGLLAHEEKGASGCLIVRADSGGIDNRPSPNGPLIYLSVEGRLNEAVNAARANGGKVLRERQQIGEHGFRAVVVDSEGNRIALLASG